MDANRWLPWRHGIQARFLPVLAVFVVVSMTALGATLFFNQRQITIGNYERDTREALQVLHDKGAAYSIFLARIAPQGILAHDYLLLEGYAEELSNDPDIVYAVILNRAHKPITHFLKKTGLPAPASGAARVGPAQFSESLTKVRADPALMIVKREIQYNGMGLGSVEVGLSQARIARHLDELKVNLKQELRRIALVTGGEILIALAALILLSEWAFSRVVVRPIRALAEDMARIQSGDLGARARIDHEDEIGWLARGFNRMAADLQEHLRKIQEQRQTYKETRDYLANILDNSADMIVTTALDGSVVEFNAAAERLLGYDRESLVGTSWEKICPPSVDRPEFRDILRGTGPVPSFETTLVHRNGSVMDAELTISALYDNTGQAIGAVYIGRDITRAKAMRRELIQAEKMASIGQVASWIAHQIRNVLGRLLMHLSALRPPETASPSLKKAHQEFLAGIREMDTLVTDLLEYSKTLTLHPAPMKFNKMIDGLIATHVPDRPDGRLRIERHYDAHLPPVNADIFKVEQAIGNMLKNAVDVMPEGGTLRITTRHDPRTRAVAVVIEDTGPGIRPDDLPRVFRPFFTTKTQGTGLGLAMAARIVEAHGGSIRAENRPQGGACFAFTLPVSPRKTEPHE